MSDIAALVAGNLDLWTSATQRKSGAGRGGGKRISLYGIERLRALILDLAVRGKLVPQDAGDEPAGELLKRIKAVNSAGRKQAKKQIKQPLILPMGWVFLPFGELADDISTGPFGTMIHKEDYVSGGIPLINPSHMIDDRIVEDTSVSLPISKAEELGAYGLRSGDIVFARRGEVGRLAIVTEREDGWLCGTGSFRARFFGNEVQPYLLKFFRSHTARSFLGGASVGATMANLNQSILSGLPVPLPPLAEQRRIVAKVDELIALCDALERESADAMAAHQALVEALLATLVRSADAAELATNWARLEQHFDTLFTTEASIDALKQTILDLAVRGKLVEQDAGDEAASEMVKQTMASKLSLVKQGKTKRDKPLPKVKASDAPFELPGGWAWARFPELGIFERGKSKHRPRNDPKLFKPGIYPLVQTGEVARSDGVIQEFHSEYSEIGLAQSKLWPAGTLCITIAANIADVATLGFDACFPDSVVGFIPCKPITNPQYFLYFMKTAKADLLKFAPSTAQKNINLGILETVLIPIPPLTEQQRIVAKVDALMAHCDALKARITDAATTQKHLADAITERAAA